MEEADDDDDEVESITLYLESHERTFW